MKTLIQQLIKKYDRPLEKDHEYWVEDTIDDAYEYGVEVGIMLIIDELKKLEEK